MNGNNSRNKEPELNTKQATAVAVGYLKKSGDQPREQLARGNGAKAEQQNNKVQAQQECDQRSKHNKSVTKHQQQL